MLGCKKGYTHSNLQACLQDLKASEGNTYFHPLIPSYSIKFRNRPKRVLSKCFSTFFPQMYKEIFSPQFYATGI